MVAAAGDFAEADDDVEKRLSKAKHAPDLLDGPDINQESELLVS